MWSQAAELPLIYRTAGGRA